MVEGYKVVYVELGRSFVTAVRRRLRVVMRRKKHSVYKPICAATVRTSLLSHKTSTILNTSG